MDGGQGDADTIVLRDRDGLRHLAAGDWTLTLSRGTAQDAVDGLIVLSEDAAGTIHLRDGSLIDFVHVDRLLI